MPFWVFFCPEYVSGRLCVSLSLSIVMLSARNAWGTCPGPSYSWQSLQMFGPALVVPMIARCTSTTTIRELLKNKVITHRSRRVPGKSKATQPGHR